MEGEGGSLVATRGMGGEIAMPDHEEKTIYELCFMQDVSVDRKSASHSG